RSRRCRLHAQSHRLQSRAHSQAHRRLRRSLPASRKTASDRPKSNNKGRKRLGYRRFFSKLLDALNFMLALLLVTLGLVVIFGLMNVINMAHGEFFLIGAYCVVMVERAGYTFWWALLLSPLVLAIIGLALEELVVRHTYRRFIDSILATWGI